VAPPYKPDLLTTELLAALGAPAGGIETLRAAEPARLIEAQAALDTISKFGRHRDYAIDSSGLGLRPSVDGVVVHSTPAEVVAARGDASVPLLIGFNEHEGTLFTMLLPSDLSDEEICAALPETITDTRALAAAYAARNTGRRLIIDLLTDAVFVVPSLRLADAQSATAAPVWVYRFTWRTPVFGGLFGATHALELPFLWDQIDNPLWRPFVGDDPPHALVTAMQGAWIAFARTGDPNATDAVAWPRYDATTRSMLELGAEIRAVDDPCRDERELWARVSLPS
jgi:para-nitrobenzyl esterase